MRNSARFFRNPLIWSIGTKLSLTLFVTVYGVALAIGFYAIQKQEAVMEEELIRQGSVTAEHFARLSIDPVLREDIWELYKLSRDISREGGPVLHALVLNMKGELLAHSHPAEYTIAIRNPQDPLLGETLPIDQTTLFPLPNGNSGYEVAAPVILDQRKIGIVRVGISKQQMEEVLRGARKDLLFISGLLALGGFSLGFFLSRRMTHPLKVLTRSVEKWGQQGFDREVFVETAEKDEIGRLVDTFNEMAKNLWDKIGEIQQTKRYLENLLENAHDFIYTLDLQGRITYVNQKFEELGYCRENLLNQPLETLFPKNSEEKTPAGEVEIQDAKGRRVIFALSTSILKDNEGRIIGTLGIAKDITERKELEHRVIRSERLASIGELAGELAHEIRNPLGSIYTAANLLTYDAGAVIDTDHLTLLEIVKQEARKLKRILTDFLHFARPNQPDLTPCDINKLCEQTLEILQYDEAARGKELQKNLDPFLPSLLVDADQIKQVLWNIALNALQAMENSGTLSITTSSLNDKELLITIQDTGSGIAKEEMGKIFEPFYSKKKKDGSGLGLAIAHRIVEAHGGRIEVESVEKKGTTMHIILPIYRGEE